LKKISQLQSSEDGAVKDQAGDAGTSFPKNKMVKRMNRLGDIAVRIDAGTTRDEILNIVRSESKQLFAYDVCLLGLLSQSKTHYVINTLSPVAEATELNHKIFSLDEGMVGWVIKNHSPILGEIDSGPAFSHAIEGKLKEFGIHSFLIVPMRNGAEVIGSLVIGSTVNNAYSDEDLSVAKVYATFLASAINHVNLMEDAEKRMTQIEVIYDVAQQIQMHC
jgi:signal transduction protein with GAF and PtsI domain